MDKKDTVIVVGVTELDQWGNMLVTPQGGGEKIKIAKKRENLHGLFQQGRAIMLHWETYMNKPYVSDAKPVEGELPPPQEPKILPRHEAGIERAKESVTPKTLPPPQELGMWWKELGNRIGDGSLDRDFPHSAVAIKGQYYKKLSEITGVIFKS